LRMKQGEHWHCMDPECGCEIIVSVGANSRGHTNPKCSCGAPMKKLYRSPVVRIVDNEEEWELLEGKGPARTG